MRSVISYLFPSKPTVAPTNYNPYPSAIRDGSIARLVKARDYHSQHADKWNNIADDAALRAREHEAVYTALNETLTRLTNPEWFGNGISGRDDAEHWANTDQLADDLVRELSAPRFNVSDPALVIDPKTDFVGNTGFDHGGAIPPASGLPILNVVDSWDDLPPINVYDPKPRYTGDDADFVSPNEPPPLDALREPDDDDTDPLLDADENENARDYGRETAPDVKHV